MKIKELKAEITQICLLLKHASFDLNTHANYLVSFESMYFIKDVSDSIWQLEANLAYADDDYSFTLDRDADYSEQTNLPDALAPLVLYVHQIKAHLADRWQKIRGTDACYPHAPYTLVTKICERLANVCAKIFYAKKPECQFHPYEFLMPGIDLQECRYTNFNKYYGLNEFILKDNHTTPIVIADFFAQTSYGCNLEGLAAKYSMDEFDRIRNHSDEAEGYYDVIFLKKDAIAFHAAKTKFLEKKSEARIRSTYSEKGRKLLFQHLFGKDDAKQLIKIMTQYLPTKFWSDFISLVGDEAKKTVIARELFQQRSTLVKDDVEQIAIKIFYEFVLKSPMELAFFLKTRIENVGEWQKYLKLLKYSPSNTGGILLDDQINETVSFLAKFDPEKIPSFISVVSSDLKIQANLLLAHCDVSHWQLFISAAKADKTLQTPYLSDYEFQLLTHMLDKSYESQWPHILGYALNSSVTLDQCCRLFLLLPKSKWQSLFTHISDENLFSMVLGINIKLLTGYETRVNDPIPFYSELDTHFDKTIANKSNRANICEDNYQRAMFSLIVYAYERIRDKLPETQSNFAMMKSLWSSSVTKTIKLAGCATLRSLLTLEDDKYLKLNQIFDHISDELKGAFSNGKLYTIKEQIEQMADRLYATQLSFSSH